MSSASAPQPREPTPDRKDAKNSQPQKLIPAGKEAKASPPKLDAKAAEDADRILVIGDIDANPLLLLNYLITNGVATIRPEVWSHLITIYEHAKNHPITAEIAKQFYDLLWQIQIDINKLQALVLIGDTLSDRGNNDIFMLFVYLWLQIKNFPLKILISNHDVNFFYLLAAKEMKNEYAYDIPNIHGQTQSLINLVSSLNTDHPPITFPQIRAIIDLAYLPNLQAVGCAASRTKMSVMTHAASDLEQIRKIAHTLGLDECKTEPPRELVITIGKINQEFIRWARKPGGLSALVALGELANREGYSYAEYNSISDAVIVDLNAKYLKLRCTPPYQGADNYAAACAPYKLFWNRDCVQLHLKLDYELYAKLGCQLELIHGHDCTEAKQGLSFPFVKNVNSAYLNTVVSCTLHNQSFPRTEPLPLEEQRNRRNELEKLKADIEANFKKFAAAKEVAAKKTAPDTDQEKKRKLTDGDPLPDQPQAKKARKDTPLPPDTKRAIDLPDFDSFIPT